MTRPMLVLCTIFAMITCLGSAFTGIRTRLKSHTDACYGYEATRASSDQAIRVDVHYRLTKRSDDASSATPKVTAAVRGPAMVKVSDNALAISGEEDQFSFNVVMSGLHRICFSLRAAVVTSLDLELHIVGQNDRHDVVSTFDGTDVYTPLRDDMIAQYSDVLEAIQSHVEVTTSEIEYMSGKQTDFENTVQSTYIRVITFTIINVVLAAAVCAWQVLTLKQFFLAKKIV